MSEKKRKEKNFIPKQWVGCPVEAEYFGDERKLSKQERKIASAKDRSKYKKTDQDKAQKSADLQKIDKENLLSGRVLSIEPEGMLVDHMGTLVTCKLRGVLKKEKTKFKNLVTVGDIVLFEPIQPQEGVIVHIEPRRSILSRADNLSRQKEQLIAANIDQVFVTTSVVSPPLKPFLVDRYIIAAKKGNMDPIIVVNKIDLLEDPSVEEHIREQEKMLYDDFIEAYRAAGIPVITVSVISGDGLNILKATMSGKASVFSGQSGVGKSSLINAIMGTQLKTGKIVDRTQKGSHTTTKTQLLALDLNSWCVDTPGIRSFGIWNLNKDEVQKYFSEIYQLSRECKFPNCSHRHEEECAVLDAVEKGKLSAMRYDSYQYLMESIAQEHLRR